MTAQAEESVDDTEGPSIRQQSSNNKISTIIRIDVKANADDDAVVSVDPSCTENVSIAVGADFGGGKVKHALLKLLARVLRVPKGRFSVIRELETRVQKGLGITERGMEVEVAVQGATKAEVVQFLQTACSNEYIPRWE
jgi:uncharacterized protein YggU (UPF0235/DUF167 family)